MVHSLALLRFSSDIHLSRWCIGVDLPKCVPKVDCKKKTTKLFLRIYIYVESSPCLFGQLVLLSSLKIESLLSIGWINKKLVGLIIRMVRVTCSRRMEVLLRPNHIPGMRSVGFLVSQVVAVAFALAEMAK